MFTCFAAWWFSYWILLMLLLFLDFLPPIFSFTLPVFCELIFYSSNSPVIIVWIPLVIGLNLSFIAVLLFTITSFKSLYEIIFGVSFICPQLPLIIFERKKSPWVFIKKGHSYAFPILIKPKGFVSSKERLMPEALTIISKIKVS